MYEIAESLFHYGYLQGPICPRNLSQYKLIFLRSNKILTLFNIIDCLPQNSVTTIITNIHYANIVATM